MRAILALALLTAGACRKPCETTDRPVVLVHGFLASGDTWARQAQRFVSNGSCDDRVTVFDWNSLGGADESAALDAHIDAVRSKFGVDKVDLAGHSAGGGVATKYLSDPARAAKVAHYAHVASGKLDAAPPVPTLKLFSGGDFIVKDQEELAGATNVRLPDADHYEVATSAASFEAMYRHFHDGAGPKTLEITPEESPLLSGKVVTLGENAPQPGAKVSVFRVDPATGARLDADPDETFEVDAEGSWGPFEAATGARYELLVTPADFFAQPVRYYRDAFVRSDAHVYLRTIPPPSTLAGAFLAGVKYDDAHAVIVVFAANRALIQGRDTLVVGGVTVTTPELAKQEKSLIAAFLFDADQDGASGGKPLASFQASPFLGGMDAFFAGDGKPVEVAINGKTLHVPAWPSASEGPVVVVVE